MFASNSNNQNRSSGLAPAIVDTLQQLEDKAYKLLAAKSSPVDKYMFLSFIRSTNVDLFFRLVLKHLTEIAPIIYTPTIGEVCQNFSNLYSFLAPPGNVNGLYIPIDQVDNIDGIINNYIHSSSNVQIPEITVITDGSRILGLGDLGLNGMGIPIGKLQLYVAGAGLNPHKTLPIVLDFGTNNETYLNDPNYLGLKRRRPDEAEFYSCIDKVLKGLNRNFPKMFIQFEDFSTDNAFGILEKYRNKYLCFNDDIQGTGSVIMSGFINAIRLSGKSPLDHKILFCGAGSAAVGVADCLVEYFVFDCGISYDKARSMFYLVDTKGLITLNRGDNLAKHKVPYARKDNGILQYKTLEESIQYVKPTAIIGLSTVHGHFSPQIISRLTELNSPNRPIIFPLSNPETKAECTFEDAMIYSNNSVIFASGTAFPKYTIPGTSITRTPGQGNNMYVFPSIGLGSVLANPKHVTNSMIYSISKALANSLNASEKESENLYPELDRLREVSAELTSAFIHQSVAEGLAQDEFWINLATTSPVNGPAPTKENPTGSFSQSVLRAVKEKMWSPAEFLKVKEIKSNM
ncbi:NADP-dependent malic enzyme [Smittium culicis]|uniref:Malic enzyme n=1 Tax=Smittium culicis TaxID=133412 RepID=A0A1R1XZY8_9FUNG|nr:NADP-dependent malic enzyme [Smittium culicis]